MADCTVFAVTIRGKDENIYFERECVESGNLLPGTSLIVTQRREKYGIVIGTDADGIQCRVMSIFEAKVRLTPEDKDRDASIVYLALEEESITFN